MSRPLLATILYARPYHEDPDYICSSSSDSKDVLLEYDTLEEEEELIIKDSVNRAVIVRLQKKRMRAYRPSNRIRQKR